MVPQKSQGGLLKIELAFMSLVFRMKGLQRLTTLHKIWFFSHGGDHMVMKQHCQNCANAVSSVVVEMWAF